MNLLINLLVILIVVAVIILVLYLFEKYVMPVDGKVKGIIIFIVFALLCIYALTGHSLYLWR